MAETIRFSFSFKILPSRTTPFRFHLSRDFLQFNLCQNLSSPIFRTRSLPRKLVGFHFPGNFHVFGEKIEVISAWNGEGSLQELDDSPVSVELEPICSESQFDRVIAEAQQLEESIIVVWMASWCRKCIYLKPKLEKLAADYYPRLRFYCVDVNNVPHKLVAYAGVAKMPTIQNLLKSRILNQAAGLIGLFIIIDKSLTGLWKDSKKQAEVIGGHKAHIVINEVREMIENESTL